MGEIVGVPGLDCPWVTGERLQRLTTALVCNERTIRGTIFISYVLDYQFDSNDLYRCLELDFYRMFKSFGIFLSDNGNR